jgi:serine/threonine protein kinase/Tol biopolymer transport system component
MSLAIGTRLGSYEITGPLGAGGMGEVYRARDTELGREVAIKVLPASFTSDASRVARFEQEAKTLASLNHPNIAHIYGLERSDGTTALAIELVEGPTLAERIAAGPLPVEEALGIAGQIADALEAAHERGIVHRDLKPANVKLTPNGVVKVLDFGIAKALDTRVTSSGNAPVLTTPTMTAAGLVLGTAAYMSPEQARGKPVDERADIWSFGCVLYEMLTGQLAFGGEDVTIVLARVLERGANLEALPNGVSPAVRRTLELCFEKDPRQRIADIRDVRLALEGQFETDARSASDQRIAARGWQRVWPLVAGLIVGGLVVGVAFWAARPSTDVPSVSHRYALPLPKEAELPAARAFAPQAVVSPDGRYLAFTAEDPATARTSLWVQAMSSLTAQRIDRTEGADVPFWSPDSKQIAYFANDKLMRVPVAAGAPLTVCNAPQAAGGTWLETPQGDNVIVFGSQGAPLNRVPAGGGIPTPVTSLADGEFGHFSPQALPDGRVLYAAFRLNAVASYVQTLGSDDRTEVAGIESRAVYAPPGFLLYVREGVLLAQRFDLDSLALRGDPTALADGVRYIPAGGSAFTASANTIVYRGLSGFNSRVRVRWYERDGTPGDAVVDAGYYSHVELSPDNRYLALVNGVTTGNSDLWIKDLSSGAFQRLAFPERESQEVWAPDSRYLAYSGGAALFYTELGSGQRNPVPNTEGLVLVHSWTPDGKYLIGGPSGGAIRLIPAPRRNGAATGATEAPREVFAEPYSTDHFRVSPDGQWIAYSSQESGRPEIMVARFPSFTDRRQVSTAGGTQPQWRADGRELFFHANDLHMMAVDVTPGESLTIGGIHELFATNPTVHSTTIFMYAATRDGQRFLMTEPAEAALLSDREPLYVLTNWQTLLNGK